MNETSDLEQRIATMTAEDLVGVDVASLTREEASAFDARIEQLRTEREERAHAADRARKRAQEARDALFEEQILPELVEKHGEVGKELAVIPHVDGHLVIKRPHPAAFKRFADAKKITTDVCEKLVRPCVVHPDKAKLDALFDDRPALIVIAANRAGELARGARKELEGK